MWSALLPSVEDMELGEFPMISQEVIWKVFFILLLGAVGIPILLKAMGKLLKKSQKLASLEHYILSTLKIGLWFFVILMVADALGIPVNSIFALLGVVGIAVSLALQNTLSNFAGGLQVLASQPFQVGDYIETDQGSGTVVDIGLAYSKLATVDNKEILIPNALMAGMKIVNYTASGVRRVDLLFSASYDAPTAEVRSAILEVVDTLPQVHQDPPPIVYLSQFADHAIVYSLRVWTDVDQYWDLYYTLMEEVRESFARHNISIPYPQMTLHLAETAKNTIVSLDKENTVEE